TFITDTPPPENILKVDQSVAVEQQKRLRELRIRRDTVAVNQILGRLKSAALGSENLTPIILEAVERQSTLGEISDTLRQCWGEYRGGSV
ncbi:MAG: methylmalonyl-CoA mutase family protein, partial [bacterium]